MTYRVEVNWGYWMFYAAQPFHHVDYQWDGAAWAEKGSIEEAFLIQYDMVWHSYGPSVPRKVALAQPQWRWHASGANRRIGGVELVVEGNADTVIHIDTRVESMCFSLSELTQGRTVVKHVGGRYSCVSMTAKFSGTDERLYSPCELREMTRGDRKYRRLYRMSDLPLAHQTIRLEQWALVRPGARITVELETPSWGFDGRSGAEVTLTLAGMHFPNDFSMRRMMRLNYLESYTEETVNYDFINYGQIPFAVSINGCVLCKEKRVFQGTGHLREVPGLEELTLYIPRAQWSERDNTLCLENRSDCSDLYLARVFVEETGGEDILFDRVPAWVLPGQTHYMTLRARRDFRTIEISADPSVRILQVPPTPLQKGDYLITFTVDGTREHPTICVKVDTEKAVAHIGQVIHARQEDRPMQIGAEGLLFLPNDPVKTEKAIEYVALSQIASHFAFRGPGSARDFTRWIEACRRYNITYSFDLYAGFYDFGAVHAQGDPLFTGGLRLSECDGAIWGYTNQQSLYESIVNRVEPQQRTMRTAAESFLTYWRELSARKRGECGTDVDIWGHVSSICHRYLYRAGIKSCVSQLNKTHNVLLLSEARGACRAAGGVQWGSYSAEGAHLNPETDQNLRMWKLQFMISYAMGASCANDEEHLLRTWHERLYGNHDRELAKRQAVSRDFLMYTKTHPRKTDTLVPQAVLMGRYACDVSDGLATHFGNPPRVWGFFGSDGPQWAYGTPEYGMRCMEAFFPGVWLHSLIQSPEAVRHWYSGTPLGETDLIDVDSAPDVLSRYPLLTMMGWNTADEAQYDSLKQYVYNGGTLIMCLPQWTKNEDRSFLTQGLEPLNLVNNGDLTALFGVRILGKGGKFENVEIASGIEDNPLREACVTEDEFFVWTCPMRPQSDHVYMANVQVQDAQVLGWEKATKQPFLVRRKLGKGTAYLFTAWDYFGNSRLTGMATDVISAIANAMPRRVSITDGTGDVYYTVREEEQDQLRVSFINTDWTAEGNVKRVAVCVDGWRFRQEVPEGRISELVANRGYAVRTSDELMYIESVKVEKEQATVTLMGQGQRLIQTHIPGCDQWKTLRVDFDMQSVQTLCLTSQEQDRENA